VNSTLVYEDGDNLYLVAPVTPFEASQEEIAGFAYGGDLLKRAPNPHIAWFRGHYVEADKANGNGAMWTGDEIAIKALTPMLMPVTVMHDPRTAVGAIADLALRTPDADKVPRAKIDTVLALWAHRFPDVVEEARHNYEHGSLMQSMECLAPNYECGTCGMGFTKLPRGAEQAHWCAHLKGETDVTPVRILRSVVFTGTGLIFGSRGATGADPNANLETFHAEVAEFHQRAHRTSYRPRRRESMEKVEIDKKEYDELRARPEQRQLDEVNERASKAEKELETEETARKKAESERDELKTKVDAHEETSRQAQLRDERMDKLGAGFTAKLGDKTKDRLRKQAAQLSDEDWTARLEELEELTSAKRDDGAPEGGGDDTFTAEEIARHQSSGGTRSPSEPTEGQRRSVFAGLS
jgi:hypothetical protein